MIAPDTDALVGAAAVFRTLDKDQRKDISAATRNTLRPLWQRVVATRVRVAQRSISPRQDAIVGPGTASMGVAGTGTLRAYTNARRLSGGMTNADWPFVEFGTYTPGYAGTRLPYWTKGGRIAYPAVKSWAPTAARVWLAVLARGIRDAGVTDGRG